MDIRFDGKRALVTGAGKGIGRETAKLLSKCGAVVFALSRTQSDLDSLSLEDPSIKTLCVDLRDGEDVRRSLERIGPIDLLVNNAGVNNLQSFFEITPEAFDEIISVNVKAVIQVSQIVARTMVAKGRGGAIVNISSQASLVAITNHTIYCASKAALDAITRNMAFELGPKQIRVNAVNPTVILTELGRAAWSDPQKCDPMKARIPLGHFGEVADVTNTIMFLLSDRSAMINGVTLPIDGGFTVCGV